jgi:hypothetical protein
MPELIQEYVACKESAKRLANLTQLAANPLETVFTIPRFSCRELLAVLSGVIG